jgi:hypothetical protein
VARWRQLERARRPLAILRVGTIAGFGVDIPGFVKNSPPPPRVIWVHGAVFTMWMILLTVQVLLVLRDRVAWHRRLGWFVAGWACVMAVMGPWAAVVSEVYAFTTHNPAFIDPPFLTVIIVDITGFLALLAWGIMLRKNPAAHRRMMILATISLADPGFGRFSGWLWPNEPSSVVVWFFYVFYGNVLVVALMAAWDWWRGRLMRSFVIGAAALLSAEFLATVLNFWQPWQALTTGWVEAWAKHVA